LERSTIGHVRRSDSVDESIKLTVDIRRLDDIGNIGGFCDCLFLWFGIFGSFYLERSTDAAMFEEVIL
jgi:hypothetical protein